MATGKNSYERDQNGPRPKVWRVLGIAGIRAEIEPWDDAAMCNVSEAYSITTGLGALEPANCTG
jgi:hypothetical protein